MKAFLDEYQIMSLKVNGHSNMKLFVKNKLKKRSLNFGTIVLVTLSIIISTNLTFKWLL